MAGNAKAKSASAEMLGLINRLLRQKRSDRAADKLYSLHAPEVECIGKGRMNERGIRSKLVGRIRGSWWSNLCLCLISALFVT